MRVLLFTDVHIHTWSGFGGVSACGRNNRSQAVLDALDAVAEVSIEADRVVCLGDFFHHRLFMDWDIVVAAKRHLDRIRVPLYLIVGNHDIIKGGSSSLELFERKGVKVVSEPLVEDWDGVSVGLIPWGYRGADCNADVIFGHLEIKGALIGDGIRCCNGSDVEKFKDKRVVFSGHFHKRQQLGSNVFYIGCLIQHSFGEEGLETGYWWYELGGDWKIVDVPAPIYVTCSLQDILEGKAPLRSKSKKGVFLRLLVPNSKDDIEVMEKILPEVKRTYKVLDVETVFVDNDGCVDVEKAARGKEDHSFLNFSFEEIIDSYIKSYSGGLDPRYLRNVGRKLYEAYKRGRCDLS